MTAPAAAWQQAAQIVKKRSVRDANWSRVEIEAAAGPASSASPATATLTTAGSSQFAFTSHVVVASRKSFVRVAPSTLLVLIASVLVAAKLGFRSSRVHCKHAVNRAESRNLLDHAATRNLPYLAIRPFCFPGSQARWPTNRFWFRPGISIDGGYLVVGSKASCEAVALWELAASSENLARAPLEGQVNTWSTFQSQHVRKAEV
jgi:hypothetical protein